MRRLTPRPLLIVAAVVAIDLITKEWVRTTVALGSRTPLAGDLLVLVPGYNVGIALGLFQAQPDPIAFLSLLIVGILLAALLGGLLRRPLTIIGIALLTGGAVGNLIDRLQHGAVLDYLDLGLGSVRIPTFNLADVAISIGFLLALLDALRPRIEPD